MRKGHLLLVSLAAVVATLPACKKDAASIASLGPDAVVDQLDAAKVGVSVGADGHVKAAVESPDGKPLARDATGSVTFTPSAGGEPKTVPLAFDAASGTLAATGPKLDDDLTQVSWSINAGGNALADTIYVPSGGTAQISADVGASTGASATATANAGATANANAAATSTADVGPHGGTVHVVGDDHLELVSDPAGQVRVYVLAPDGKSSVAVGTRHVTIGVVAEKPEAIVLVAEPGGRFLTGSWHAHADAAHVTIACRADAHAAEKVVLVGYKPGVAIQVGASAPRVKVATVAKLDDAEHVDEGAHAGVKLEGNGNPIGTGMGKGNGAANANGNAAVALNANANAGAGAGAGAGAAAKGEGHGNGKGGGNGNGGGNGKVEARAGLDLKVK